MIWLTSEFLPLITVAAYIAASIRIVTFRRHGFTHRRVYSGIASIMVGVTLCAGFEILIFDYNVSPGQSAIALMYLFATIKAKGNVAAMVRRVS